jgi:hypothetical protein
VVEFSDLVFISLRSYVLSRELEIPLGDSESRPKYINNKYSQINLKWEQIETLF